MSKSSNPLWRNRRISPVTRNKSCAHLVQGTRTLMYRRSEDLSWPSARRNWLPLAFELHQVGLLGRRNGRTGQSLPQASVPIAVAKCILTLPALSCKTRFFLASTKLAFSRQNRQSPWESNISKALPVRHFH